jgi:hypothetical protein
MLQTQLMAIKTLKCHTFFSLINLRLKLNNVLGELLNVASESLI